MQAPRKEAPEASSLFEPSELSQYRSWRVLQVDATVLEAESLLLPTGLEYVDFQVWLYEQHTLSSEEASLPNEDAAVSPAVLGPALQLVQAGRCSHALHPGHPAVSSLQQDDYNFSTCRVVEAAPWCPKCVLVMHLRLLSALWYKWVARGGPWRVLPEGTTGEEYLKARQAFLVQKVELINALDEMESTARLEVAWETANPTTPVRKAAKEHAALSTCNAYHAYHAYHSFSKSPAHQHIESEIMPQKPAHRKQKKQQSYSPGTPEDTNHRPNELFARNAVSYDRKSPHACLTDDGWVDTALCKDWRFNVRQCRLLLCDRTPSLQNVKYQELCDDGSKECMVKSIDLWFVGMKPSWIHEWMEVLTTTTDMFLVWKGDESGKAEDGFDSWEKVDTLVGTNLEEHAFALGDIDEEDRVEHGAAEQERLSDDNEGADVKANEKEGGSMDLMKEDEGYDEMF